MSKGLSSYPFYESSYKVKYDKEILIHLMHLLKVRKNISIVIISFHIYF